LPALRRRRNLPKEPSAQPLAGGERSAHAPPSAVARKRSEKAGTPAITTELSARRRQRAITFDHNLVITAGAEPKTTLLVIGSCSFCSVVPTSKDHRNCRLTFTNKAARNETPLGSVSNPLAVSFDLEPSNERVTNLWEIESLIDRYQLSKDELDTRVRRCGTWNKRHQDYP
jgi:hypothetical protein